MAVYNYITQAQALTQLANRLYDPTEQFWSHAEKTLYLQEALRCWNALTGFWRGDFVGPTQNRVVFYDLTSATTFPNTLRPLTLHDTDLYPIIQSQLLEPAVGVNPWTGVSTQFTADDLINAVQRRRDELLSISGCTYTRRTVPAVPGRIQLPDSVIDIRRVAYLINPSFAGGGFAPNGYGMGGYGLTPYGGTSGIVGVSNSVLFQDDTWGEQSYNRGFTTKPPGSPIAWMQSTQPPVSFDVDRPPAYGGNYEVLTVDAGAALSPTVPQLLSVPDDWAWAIKWGALADLLLRDASAKDSSRAAYCEQRYRMATALLTDAPATLAARIANTPLQIDSVKLADQFRAFWQALTPAQPDTLLTAGLNLIAFAPTPNAGPYSVTFTVVKNAPMPVSDADSVQVAREDLDAILDYSVHIAMFKTGGAEFSDTMPLFERFLKQAGLYNTKLMEWGEFSKILNEVSSLEEDYNPRTAPQEAGS